MLEPMAKMLPHVPIKAEGFGGNRLIVAAVKLIDHAID